MSFTEGEVRERLNDLGYMDIPDSKLKEFVKDLHELAHHDQCFVNTEQDDPPSWASNHFSMVKGPFHHTGLSHTKRKAFSKEMVSGMDYEVNGVKMRYESDNESTISKESFHSVQELDNSILHRKVARKRNGHLHVVDETCSENDNSISYQSPYRENYNDDTRFSVDCMKSIASSERQRNQLPAFIRTSYVDPYTKELKKSDPVSRYHQYRAFWKENNVPGEAKHSSVRWNVRADMFYHYEMFEKPQRRYQSNNYVIPTSKKRQALRWQVRSALAEV